MPLRLTMLSTRTITNPPVPGTMAVVLGGLLEADGKPLLLKIPNT